MRGGLAAADGASAGRIEGARLLVMAKAPEGIASELHAAGWAGLADGEWAAASALFVDALAWQETPEALEGLSCVVTR